MMETRRTRAPRALAALAAAAGIAFWTAGAPPARAEETAAPAPGDARPQGYLALPTGEGTHPALVVIHEWWGLDDWVKQQADSLAKRGYIAFAVDLYQGKSSADPLVAHQLMSGLAEDEALRTLRAAADSLRARADVRANAVGVMGWCMGGKYSIRLAAADPGIRACVMYYGAPITDEKAIRGLQAAILGHFGGDDKGPSPAQVRAFEKALKEAGKKVDFKIYPGAGHAFANVNNPWGGYRAAAAKDAWKRTLAFLAAELRQPSVPKPLRK